MTRLFNLESYSELCSYAQLYNKDITSSISAYKAFLDGFQSQGYLADSSNGDRLSFSQNPIGIQSLGIDLTGNQQKLYIVPDRLNLLSLRTLLKPGESYLYKSAYHYWNYHSQIPPIIASNKPIIFLDLNSLTSEEYCPITFKSNSNSPHLIPILDNRKKLTESLKLNLDHQQIYEQICRAIAVNLISANFPQLSQDSAAIQHLAKYLQKINFFTLLQSDIPQQQISFLVEILSKSQIYYKQVALNVTRLQEVILREINPDKIKTLVQKHQQYLFVLISDYNTLPIVRESLSSNNLLIVDHTQTEFELFWQQKQQQKFPLFGQYLDKIKFQISMDDKPQWVDLLSVEEQKNIYYEGEQETKIFTGRIAETGREDFTLPHPHGILPIQINDTDYYINGVKQDYFIKNPLEKPGELKIKLEFALKPGYAPELRVRDIENKYQIESELRDHIIPKYDHIPLAIIEKHRNSAPVPSPDQYQIIIDNLSQLTNLSYYQNNRINQLNQINEIKTLINKAYDKINQYGQNKLDLLLNVDSAHSSLESLRGVINNSHLSPLINFIYNYLTDQYNPKFINFKTEGPEVRQAIERFVIFLGKTYKFSQSLSLTKFFDNDTIKAAYRRIGSEYILFLSRVACSQELQIKYLIFFAQPLDSQRICYKLTQYLWGYGRILVWYADFIKLVPFFDYIKHFNLILKYLETNDCPQDYRRNAFLALIYLLSFREVNQKFCLPESSEYSLAQKVLSKSENQPVYLKVVPDKSLNDYFKELLEGTCPMKDMDKLIGSD